MAREYLAMGRGWLDRPLGLLGTTAETLPSKESRPNSVESGPGGFAMRKLVGILLLFIVMGCSANRRRAGTGDVAFRLTWEGLSDLDLIVQDPSGACIFFGLRESQSGGVLDVDCNAGTDFTCERPIENVFWQPSTAPPGSYWIWVHAHALIPVEAPLPFRLQVLRGTEVAWINEDKVVDHEEVRGPYVYQFPGGTVTAPPQDASSHPLCAGRDSGVRTSR